MSKKILYVNELSHHGVKGMKWGVRNDDKYNSKYSTEQRLRDKNVYGQGGVRRINRSLNKGESVSSARSKEAGRIYNHRRASVAMRNVGQVAGGVGGAVAGYYISKKILSKYGTGDTMADMMIKTTVATGSYKVGSFLGQYGGQSIGMLSGGYSPSKFRYS